MLNMSPYAPCWSQTFITLHSTWFLVVHKNPWLVYTCFCTLEVLVCLRLPWTFWNESFKEEVVQFVELNCPLGSKNVYSPMQAAPCHALEGRNGARRERELEGKTAFQLKCWPVLGCTVVGTEAWTTCVVFNQVQVGPSCWWLVFGVGR